MPIIRNKQILQKETPLSQGVKSSPKASAPQNGLEPRDILTRQQPKQSGALNTLLFEPINSQRLETSVTCKIECPPPPLPSFRVLNHTDPTPVHRIHQAIITSARGSENNQELPTLCLGLMCVLDTPCPVSSQKSSIKTLAGILLAQQEAQKSTKSLSQELWQNHVKEGHAQFGLTEKNIEGYVQWVLRQCYLLQSKELYYFARRVKFYNDLKKRIRQQLDLARQSQSQDGAGLTPEDFIYFDPQTGEEHLYGGGSTDSVGPAPPPKSTLPIFGTLKKKASWTALQPPKPSQNGYGNRFPEVDPNAFVFTTPHGEQQNLSTIKSAIEQRAQAYKSWFAGLPPDLQKEILQELASPNGELELALGARIKVPQSWDFSFHTLEGPHGYALSQPQTELQNALSTLSPNGVNQLFSSFIDEAAMALQTALEHEIGNHEFMGVDYISFGIIPTSANEPIFSHSISSPSTETSTPELGSSAGGAVGESPDLESYIEKLEQDLQSVGDDAQMANVDLQNILQKQQQTLRTLSNASKVWHESALAIIRNMGA